MDVHRTAHNHGIDDAVIRHTVNHALTIVDLGRDRAGNLLAVIWLELAHDAEFVILAMRLRTIFSACFQRNPWRSRHDRSEHPPHR